MAEEKELRIRGAKMITDVYTSGEEAVKLMISRIEYINSNNKKADEDELSMLNKMYFSDRLAAMILGADVSRFPRRLKINTKLPK